MPWNSRSRRKFEVHRIDTWNQIGCQIPVIRRRQLLASKRRFEKWSFRRKRGLRRSQPLCRTRSTYFGEFFRKRGMSRSQYPHTGCHALKYQGCDIYRIDFSQSKCSCKTFLAQLSQVFFIKYFRVNPDLRNALQKGFWFFTRASCDTWDRRGTRHRLAIPTPFCHCESIATPFRRNIPWITRPFLPMLMHNSRQHQPAKLIPHQPAPGLHSPQ